MRVESLQLYKITVNLAMNTDKITVNLALNTGFCIMLSLRYSRPLNQFFHARDDRNLPILYSDEKRQDSGSYKNENEFGGTSRRPG